METDIAAERLQTVNASIARAAATASRIIGAVELVAVSKTHPASEIVPLLAAGHRSFGENRVQEAAGKWPELRAGFSGITLHLVGQLQSNKAREAVELFDVIHSVDRLSLVTALVATMDATGKRPDCYIQVNIGDEPQKGGVALADLDGLLGQARVAGLPVIGLMAVPPEGIEAAPFFALLAKRARDLGLPKLSMGMSTDYEIAVLLGATCVRVGSALFGGRTPLVSAA